MSLPAVINYRCVCRGRYHTSVSGEVGSGINDHWSPHGILYFCDGLYGCYSDRSYVSRHLEKGLESTKNKVVILVNGHFRCFSMVSHYFDTIYV